MHGRVACCCLLRFLAPFLAADLVVAEKAIADAVALTGLQPGPGLVLADFGCMCLLPHARVQSVSVSVSVSVSLRVQGEQCGRQMAGAAATSRLSDSTANIPQNRVRVIVLTGCMTLPAPARGLPAVRPVVPPGGDGQVVRLASRMGLAAFGIDLDDALLAAGAVAEAKDPSPGLPPRLLHGDVLAYPITGVHILFWHMLVPAPLARPGSRRCAVMQGPGDAPLCLSTWPVPLLGSEYCLCWHRYWALVRFYTPPPHHHHHHHHHHHLPFLASRPSARHFAPPPRAGNPAGGRHARRRPGGDYHAVARAPASVGAAAAPRVCHGRAPVLRLRSGPARSWTASGRLPQLGPRYVPALAWATLDWAGVGGLDDLTHCTPHVSAPPPLPCLSLFFSLALPWWAGAGEASHHGVSVAPPASSEGQTTADAFAPSSLAREDARAKSAFQVWCGSRLPSLALVRKQCLHGEGAPDAPVRYPVLWGSLLSFGLWLWAVWDLTRPETWMRLWSTTLGRWRCVAPGMPSLAPRKLPACCPTVLCANCSCEILWRRRTTATKRWRRWMRSERYFTHFAPRTRRCLGTVKVRAANRATHLQCSAKALPCFQPLLYSLPSLLPHDCQGCGQILTPPLPPPPHS